MRCGMARCARARNSSAAATAAARPQSTQAGLASVRNTPSVAAPAPARTSAVRHWAANGAGSASSRASGSRSRLASDDRPHSSSASRPALTTTAVETVASRSPVWCAVPPSTLVHNVAAAISAHPNAWAANAARPLPVTRAAMAAAPPAALAARSRCGTPGEPGTARRPPIPARTTVTVRAAARDSAGVHGAVDAVDRTSRSAVSSAGGTGAGAGAAASTRVSPSVIPFSGSVFDASRGGSPGAHSCRGRPACRRVDDVAQRGQQQADGHCIRQHQVDMSIAGMKCHPAHVRFHDGDARRPAG